MRADGLPNKMFFGFLVSDHEIPSGVCTVKNVRCHVLNAAAKCAFERETASSISIIGGVEKGRGANEVTLHGDSGTHRGVLK